MTSRYQSRLILSDMAWIFLLSIFVRLVFTFILRPLTIGPLSEDLLDPDRFGARAALILDGAGFVDSGTGLPELRRDPLYSYVIASAWALTGENTAVIQVLNAILGGVSAGLTYAMASMVLGRKAGWIAALLFIFSPLNIWYVPIFRYEALSTPLMALAGILFLNLQSNYRWRTAVFLGLVLGLIALTTISLVLLTGAFFLAGLIAVQRRTLLPRLAVSVICLGLTLFPWIYRNYQVSGGEFIISRGGGNGVFWLGYYAVRDYNQAPLQLTSLRKLAQSHIAEMILERSGKVSLADVSVQQQEAILQQATIDLIRDHPGQVFTKVFWQTLRFWYLADSRSKSLLILAFHVPILALAIWGIVLGLREHKPVWVFGLPILGLNLAYAFFWVEARYTVPLEPYLMSLAGLTLSEFKPIEELLNRFMHWNNNFTTLRRGAGNYG